MKSIIIGTRGSRLAIAQADIVSNLLKDIYPECNIDIKVIKTTGDKILNAPLSKIEGKGIFTKELENELLNNTIDIAVHSLKDMPVDLPIGLTIGAYLRQENPNDILISKNKIKYLDLKPGSKIGTGSARRILQLKNIRDDLNYIDIRGNIDTRIKKTETPDYDGIILAYAGINRLQMNNKITEIFSIDKVMPSVGQGVLAIECKKEKNILSIIKKINDKNTEYKMMAERELLKNIGGGCRIPLACITKLENNILNIKSRYMPDNGSFFIEKTLKSEIKNKEDAVILGKKTAENILGEYKKRKKHFNSYN